MPITRTNEFRTIREMANGEKYYLERYIHGDNKTMKDLLGMSAEQFSSLPELDKARALRDLTSEELCKIRVVYFNYIICAAKLEDMEKNEMP